MEILRYKYIFITTLLFVNGVCNEKTKSSLTTTTPKCPFTKIIEDVFKLKNKTTDSDAQAKERNRERIKLFLNTIANITNDNNISRKDEDLIDVIINAINRIKYSISEPEELNEAIIINPGSKYNYKKVVEIKSGIEERGDITRLRKQTTKHTEHKDISATTEAPKYVEVLTIPHKNPNTTSANIVEVLKHLAPFFNNTLPKEIHNITIIERGTNYTFPATKNVSTIIVTYCDKVNLTEANAETKNFEQEHDDGSDEDYYDDNDDSELEEDGEAMNLTIGEKREILEAADYGMQKMHELYTVLEPKLYSMGLWLNDTSPARYVAAFNAPAEEAVKFSRYGYASLQAAVKLKELMSGGNDDSLEGRTQGTLFPSASALRQSALMQNCPLKGAPKCQPASKRYRTHDGTCNNFNHLRWGSTMTPVQRFLPPTYSDGLQAPRRSVLGVKLPSAREISASIHEDKNAESTGVTHLLMQWGQLLDHDMTSSSQTRGFNGSIPRCCKDGGRDFVPKELLHPECLPISVPKDDPFYGAKGIRCLDFVRSAPAPRDDCSLGWREQLNQVSAYIDGSPLYGSSATKSDKLRLFRNGMLQYGRVQQRRPVLPPERRDELCRGGAVSTECFRSGDARVNEHPGLVAAHIVWMRQHNRMAQELTHLNPHWSDEKIYQETRKIIGAMIQHITYREFLPIVLGDEVIHRFELELQRKGYYKGYNPKINPSPASSFSSAAFRFGHSLVQSSMMRYDKFHRPMKNNVSLHNELANPSNIWSIGAVDRLLLGMVNQPIQKRDEFMSEELTNHLFQTPKFGFGMDLAAINIQRGRDHGVPPYTSWREPCGLSAIENFEDLFRVMPARTVRKIQTLYRHVDDIDLFTAGMAERPVLGGLVGPTFACIIAQQFSNLRKGDRFWYENGGFDSSLTPAQLQQIRRISFAQVLCRTLDSIETVQPFVFLSTDNPDNDRISCQDSLLTNFDLSLWVEIDPESGNELDKSEHHPVTTRPDTKTISKRPTTTIKNTSQKLAQKKPDLKTPKEKIKDNNLDLTSRLKDNENDELDFNLTDDITTHINVTDEDFKTETNTTTADDTRQPLQIDDKLDFKNKSRLVDDYVVDTRQRPNKYNDYDYEDDDTQQVQSVVINNVAHKRPYHQRPVITVTENIDKYTYLINYVPRPTESYRHTTRRPIRDRDIVKVTYQTYDDTYRRPNKPYYYNNRHENLDYRNSRPTYTTRHNYHSSARSNDETATQNNRATDKPDIKHESTTDLYKLVTFGYVGTYKGNTPTTEKLTDIADKEINAKHKVNSVIRDVTTADVTDKQKKLSTFYMYDSVTKPYLQRPTRHNDESPMPTNKYYYIKNVLHKYTSSEKNIPKTHEKHEILMDNYNNAGTPDASIPIEERSSDDKMASIDDIEVKPKSQERFKNRVQKPSKPAKPLAGIFEVLPSKISSSQWAVYDEDVDLPDQRRMPIIKTDPHALKEIPRPIMFNSFKRRKPALDRH